MAPVLHLDNPQDIAEAALVLRGASRVWVKLAHGAGGDTVVPVAGPITETRLNEAVRRLKHSCACAFAEADFGAEAAQCFWPEEATLPQLSAITVEQDVADLGKPVANLSCNVLVDHNGQVHLGSFFRQFIGPEGQFMGSAPCVLPQAAQANVLEQLRRVAAFAHSLNHFGCFGVDFFLIETERGALEPVVIEMNGRPSSSTNTQLVAEKLALPHWLNVNLRHERALNSMAELKNVLGGCAGLLEARAEHGCAVPLSFSSLHRVAEDGQRELIFSSSKVRFLIGSKHHMTECQTILGTLRGLGFTSA